MNNKLAREDVSVQKSTKINTQRTIARSIFFKPPYAFKLPEYLQKYSGAYCSHKHFLISFKNTSAHCRVKGD